MIATVACTSNDQAGRRLLLHADARGSLIVLKDVSQISRIVCAALVDAVETLRVFTRICVNLQLLIAAHAKFVGHGSDGHGILNRLIRLQVLIR